MSIGEIAVVIVGLGMTGLIIGTSIHDWMYGPRGSSVRYIRCGCVYLYQLARWETDELDLIIYECEHCGATWEHEESA